MMDDLVKKLKALGDNPNLPQYCMETCEFAAARMESLEAELAALCKHADILTHQIITCGVAASHPDSNLSRTGAYAGKWNSAQAEEVRKLRDAYDALRAKNSELALQVLADHGHAMGEYETGQQRAQQPAQVAEPEILPLTLEELKTRRHRLMREAEKAAYAYFCECDVGTEREKASEIYENIRTAGRVY